MSTSVRSSKYAFRQFQDVEGSMLTLVDRLFYESPFMQTLASGAYASHQLAFFARQYQYYSRHFPRVLGAAIAAMEPTDSWWVPLADNLWDEAGRGQPGKSHQQLYLTFLKSIVADDPLEPSSSDTEMSHPVRDAIELFITFFRQCSPLEAMAAVGLGSELFAGDVMGRIGAGFRHPNYQREGVINTLFWDVHSDEHEPRHYQLCRDILKTFDNPEDWDRMYEVGAYIAASEAAMYDGLHTLMTTKQRDATKG